jgi:hypothetical protein
MGYDTNDDGEVDFEVVRKWQQGGRVSKPFLIFWDRNYDGNYSYKDGEMKVRKGCELEAEKFREQKRNQAGESVL